MSAREEMRGEVAGLFLGRAKTKPCAECGRRLTRWYKATDAPGKVFCKYACYWTHKTGYGKERA